MALTSLIAVCYCVLAVIATVAFRSLGYGSSATNIGLGLGLTAAGRLALGMVNQPWFSIGFPVREYIIVVSLSISIIGTIYQCFGFWRLYTVSKGWWM